MAEEYCRRCKSKLTKCPTCEGKGIVREYRGFLSSSAEKQCKNCNGTGKLCPKHGNDWG
jgi:DnaJ-class molecular chaperone